MTQAKRKQDEKNLKLLREIAALPHNKQCADCGGRGPTYINMTQGTFVCTSCSGLLRGLNPPQRVKSISMASFTPEELEFIQSRGNWFAHKTWLGLYNGRGVPPEMESRDEQKRKDFLILKYENKRWYLAPTDEVISQAKEMNTPAPAETKPLKNRLGSRAPKLVLQQPPTQQQQQQQQGNILDLNSSQSGAPNASNANGAIVSSTSHSHQQQAFSSNSADFFGTGSGQTQTSTATLSATDPFASPGPHESTTPAAKFETNFASFDQPQQPYSQATNTGGAFGNNDQFDLFSSVAASSSNPPNQTTSTNQSIMASQSAGSNPVQVSKGAPVPSDRYKAFEDLGDLFGGGAGSGSPAASSGGIGGGMGGSLSWNATAPDMAGGGSGAMGLGGVSAFGGGTAPSMFDKPTVASQPPTAVSNPFGVTSTSGGFGAFGTSGASSTTPFPLQQTATFSSAGTGGGQPFPTASFPSAAGQQTAQQHSASLFGVQQPQHQPFGVQSHQAQQLPFGVPQHQQQQAFAAPAQHPFGQPSVAQPQQHVQSSFGSQGFNTVGAAAVSSSSAGDQAFSGVFGAPHTQSNTSTGDQFAAGGWPPQSTVNPFMSSPMGAQQPVKGASTNPFL